MSKVDVKIVIGANYGDEGKGLATHYFSQFHGTHCLNILFNGGPQRGHTVDFKENERHVFHHFGSGTYDGSDTYFDRGFMVNPIFFMDEIRKLPVIPSHIYIHPDCRVITPYDAFINQILEGVRGKNRHGSCGCGIWETQERYKDSKFALTWKELTALSDDELYKYLRKIAETYFYARLRYYNMDKTDIPDEYRELLDSENLTRAFICDLRQMQSLTTIKTLDEIFCNYERVIFEGGQGLALDENNLAAYPHVTASGTTSRAPMEAIKDFDCDAEICYITRSYFTRHGAGPFPTECAKLEVAYGDDDGDETNIPNDFQGTIRYGRFDAKEMMKRVEQDIATAKWYRANVITSMMVTHLIPICDIATDGTLNMLKHNFDKFYISDIKTAAFDVTGKTISLYGIV